MRLRAQRRMDVHIPRLGVTVAFAPREELRTEISAKFTRERLRGDLAAAGLELREVLTDPDELFALSLSTRR
jgi:L-histidine N-alpha-methyltransferase